MFCLQMRQEGSVFSLFQAAFRVAPLRGSSRGWLQGASPCWGLPAWGWQATVWGDSGSLQLSSSAWFAAGGLLVFGCGCCFCGRFVWLLGSGFP